VGPKYTEPIGHQPARRSLFVVPILEPEYECFLAPVNAAVRRVARQFQLKAADADDLRSDLWVRLLTDQGRALRRFAGRSRIETYLTHVARNLWMDRLQKLHGKWRPSAAARRAGRAAILIEQMVSRDGLSPDAAWDWLRRARPTDAEGLRGQLLAIVSRRRRRFVPLDTVALVNTGEPSPLETMCATERSTGAAAIKLMLAWILEHLSAGDRSLLVRRFALGMTIADIAAADGRDPKPLYRYFARLLNRVRVDLLREGCDASTIRSFLQGETEDWDCGLARQGQLADAASIKTA
jgi:RNA polymerase sigma factor (sigma-70 family)